MKQSTYTGVHVRTEGVYSTVVVHDECGAHMRAFYTRLGDAVSGTHPPVCATDHETNMQISGQLGTEVAEFVGLSWSIPAVVAPRLNGGASYHVSQVDVDGFLASSVLRVEKNGQTKGTFVPSAYAVEHDSGGWRQYVSLPEPMEIGPHDVFNVELKLPGDPIRLSGPKAVLSVMFRLLTKGDGIKTYGRWSSSKETEKQKAFVIVGKEGLEELVKEMLWWDAGEDEEDHDD